MTERKFTDEQIIKALECCAVDPHSGKFADCENCPLDYPKTANCFEYEIQIIALDLINRQRAEIERLKDLNNQLEIDNTNANMNLEHITYEFDLLEQEKAVVVSEAIKEFAARLKERFFNYYEGLNENTSKNNYHGETLMFYEVADMIEDCIENLVEEMTEGSAE